MNCLRDIEQPLQVVEQRADNGGQRVVQPGIRSPASRQLAVDLALAEECPADGANGSASRRNQCDGIKRREEERSAAMKSIIGIKQYSKIQCRQSSM